MTFIFYLVLFLFLGICALLCLVILIQESKSLGLGASFGGIQAIPFLEHRQLMF